MNIERPSGPSQRLRFSLLAGLLVVASGAGAAPGTRYMPPPPGLYQVKIVTERRVDSPAGAVQDRSTVDAATGAIDTRLRRADGSHGNYAVAGDGAQRSASGRSSRSGCRRNCSAPAALSARDR